jgi:acyl carrier protein
VTIKKIWRYEDIEAGLLDIIRSQKQLDETFTPRSDLAATGLDSLTMVRILVAIEEKFGVWLEGAALDRENLRNVEVMACCLEKVLAEQSSSSP